MDELKIASEIEDCDDCPLYKKDCPGGWTGGPNGPIEPPCCSWNGDEKIYEGMYSNTTHSPKELQWMQEESKRKEAERKMAEKQARREILRERIRQMTKGEYRHIEFRYRGEICYDWLCPYCHTWRHVDTESYHDGVSEAWCSRCGRRMVYCQELEDELEERK